MGGGSVSGRSERTTGHVGLRFSAVVGQDEAKQALLMAAVRPLLAGVLLRGDKGSGKTTLARGLAALLPNGGPFIELPLGATEERVIGSLDLAELLTNGAPRFQPGLLAAADGGVLYVDEINLLADHLVDTLLDVAVSGVNRVERDGLSHTHPARFVLVASMNPEEGELRPQLLDRFGLAVDVAAPADAGSRAEAVRRQLASEHPSAPSDGEFASADATLRERLLTARVARVDLPDRVVEMSSRLALEVGAEGLRADLMMCRAAVARAALDARRSADESDLRAVAGMVLGHRRRRRPFDAPGISDDELEQAWERAGTAESPADVPSVRAESPPAPDTSFTQDGSSAGSSPDPPPDGSTAQDGSPAGPRPGSSAGAEQLDPPGAAALLRLAVTKRAATADRRPGSYATGDGSRGRFIREEPYAGNGSPIDARSTALAVAARRPGTDLDEPRIVPDDLRGAQRRQRTGSLIVFVVDASASMGVEHRMSATKAAVLGLLGDAYRRRGRVALVTFSGESADVVLRPTASVEVARARLVELRTGGRTPLAAGVAATTQLLRDALGGQQLDCVVVLVTDGRATGGASGDPLAATHEAMADLVRTGARIVVLDSEVDAIRLGLAREIADAAGAEYLTLDTGEAGLEHIVRSL